MNLEVGDLFYTTMHGICVLTEKYPEGTLIYNEPVIGTFCRLSFGSRVYKLYNDEQIHEVKDETIKTFLLETMCRFELDENSTVSFDEELLCIGDELETVILTKEAALKLKEILNRELI